VYMSLGAERVQNVLMKSEADFTVQR